jgi:hypothetical protein
MKQAAAILLFFAPCAFASSPWPGVPYAEVRGYAFKDSGPEESIFRDGKLSSSIINKSGAALTAHQIQRLVRAITRKPPKVIALANCFDPHHAFIFYDARRKPVAWVDVCFHCHNATVHPYPSKSYYPDMKALLDLCGQLKLPNTPAL